MKAIPAQNSLRTPCANLGGRATCAKVSSPLLLRSAVERLQSSEFRRLRLRLRLRLLLHRLMIGNEEVWGAGVG